MTSSSITLRAASTRGGPRGARGAWWYLAPLLLILAVWVYGPALFTAVLSTLSWNLTTPADFVGIDNFVRLAREPEFGQAAGQTIVYALALLPFATVVPGGLAVMLWLRPGRAATIYRSFLFAPVMIAPVAVAVSWRFLLNPLQGLANNVIAWFGLAPVNWLGNPATALIVIVLVTAAKVTAFNLLLYGAALSAIDRRVVEAARLEGASAFEIARFVIAPQLGGTTALLALLSFILAGQWTFTNISVLTQGGPDGSTDNVYYRIYTLAFEFFETGMASAAAVAILLVVGVAGLIWTRVRRNDASA